MSATTDPATLPAKPVKEDHRWEVLLLISSLAAAILFGVTAYHEIAMAPWRKHQTEYRKLLIARATNDQARADAESFKIGYRQAYLPGLGRVDRCPTCHLGMDDSSMQEDALKVELKVEDPSTKDDLIMVLKVHPGDILEHHSVDRFGCTICHGGLGRATEKNEAHGKNSHRPAPMRSGEMLQVACAECHSDAELPGMPIYNLSRKLFTRKACLACHSLRGTGPTLRGVTAIQGPNLTEEAGKHDFQWQVDHFLDPQKVSENSKMPNFDFTEEEARALAFLMMSFTGEGPSHGFIPLPTDGGTSVLPPMTVDQLGADIDPLAALGYVGSETCLACHTALNPGLADTWRDSKMAHAFDVVQDVADNEICLPCHTTGHNPVTNVFVEPSVGCEACHGPGKQYVADALVGNFEDHKTHANAGVLEKDRCLTCHKTMHVSTENHEEAIRAEHEAPAEEATAGEMKSNDAALDRLMTSFLSESSSPAGEKKNNRAALVCLMTGFIGESASLGSLPLLAADTETAEEAAEALEMIGAKINPKAAPGYVGSEPCLFCHSGLNPEVVDDWKESKMAHAFEAVRDVPDHEICLPCHTTGHNPDTNEFVEPNVGCEACHGPGKDSCVDAVFERRAEHSERMNVNNQDKNRCAGCHRVHVPKEQHEEIMRDEEAIR